MHILQYLKSNRKRAGVICSLICLAAGVIPLVIFTFFADPAHPYSIAPVTLTSADGTQIQALVYTPLGVTGNRPGVVVGHGFTGNKRYMQPLSIELVKRGWTAISIDFRGHGSSGGYLGLVLEDPGLEFDMEAAMDYLIALGNINQIGLVGHSMGGATALRVAEQNYGRVNGTVSIGMVRTGYNFTRIPNLLMAVGQLDQVNNAEAETNFLKNYTGLSDVAFDTPYGNFGTGTACKVAIAPLTEHLFEPLSPIIMAEMVTWLEQIFNGGTAPTDVTITASFNTASLMISMAGAVCLVFMALLYLSNALWKRGLARPEREIVQKSSGMKLVMLAVLAYGIGGGFLFPLSDLFPTALPVAEGSMLFAVMVGNAIGLLVIFYLRVLRKEDRHQLPDLFGKMRQACGQTPGRSFCFGIAAALLSAWAITTIMEWSSTTTILTTREYGTAFSIAIVFFPFLFVKEFYYRTVQGRLAPTNRVKEYFKMAGIGCFIDNVVLVPVMLLVWQNSNHEVAFFALAITVFLGFNVVQQMLVTWVYQHSGRSILGSTVFFCLFYAWMVVNFFPFSLN